MNLLIRAIDGTTETIGRIVAWGVVVMVLFQITIVLARYVYSTSEIFGIPAVWLQEGVVYLHGLTIMLGAGYAFLYDGHVRVDVFRVKETERRQDLTDLLGCVLFVLPLCFLVLWAAWPNVRIAWMTLEGSIEPSGLPFRYLLKTTIPFFAVLLALQALAIAVKAFLRLTGRTSTPVFLSAPIE